MPVAVLAAVLVAGGCGLKGDLYLPEPETPVEQSDNGSEEERNDSDDDEADA